ncbi:organic anion transporter 3-like [Dermacentor albipictus]|uniref:organic anion transporter 3-like n=1 Tax=Dermacentor albipictus TaxID=60249 RepID=UPI0031FD5435
MRPVCGLSTSRLPDSVFRHERGRALGSATRDVHFATRRSQPSDGLRDCRDAQGDPGEHLRHPGPRRPPASRPLHRHAVRGGAAAPRAGRPARRARTPPLVRSALHDLPTDAWKNAAIPLGPDGEPNQCDVYDPPLTKGADQQRHVAHCKKWAYDTSNTDDSIVSRWDLVCDREWLLKLSKTVYVMGTVLFVPAAGPLADRFGSRPAIVGNAVGALVFSVGAFISERLAMFVVSRFFVSACSCSAQVPVSILLYEVTGNERRALYGQRANHAARAFNPPAVRSRAAVVPGSRHPDPTHGHASLVVLLDRGVAQLAPGDVERTARR